MPFIQTAYAQQSFIAGPSFTDLQQLDLVNVVYLFVALAILGAGALSIVFIFYGGFTFILSGGDEEKVKSAISSIRYAIIGLIITLLSFVVVPFVGKLFGVNFQFFDFKTLSNKINSLFIEFRQSSGTVSTSTDTPVATPATTPQTRTTPSVSVDDLIR